MSKLQPVTIGSKQLQIPIAQGGMGVGISRSHLAGAVAKAGGLGVLSAAQIGYDEADYEQNPLQANLRAIGKHTRRAREISGGNGMVGINIMVATKNYDQYVAASVEAGVDIIICGAGLPTELPELVRGSDVLIAPIVSSVKSAQVICKLWDRHSHAVPDLVVIEGPKAGGHLGFSKEQLETVTEDQYDAEITGILKVVQEYAAKYEKKIPVFVAGGIHNRADVAHVMALGADGVQVASRFVTTPECDASEVYKQAYLNAKEEDIVLVKSPVGMPGRALHNTFIKQCEQDEATGEHQILTKCYQCIKGCKAPDIPYCICKALINAVKGDVENGLVFCGANAYKCDHMETVDEIMQDLSTIS